jgi:uncharacterized protein (DUF1499 family)
MRLAWFTSNDVTTGETAAYPELAPRVYSLPPSELYKVMLRTAAGIPRWTVVGADADFLEVRAQVRTMLFGFVDDLTARLEPLGDGQWRVVIRSHSRVGRGDLGENARHIAALQRRMDEALARRAPP